MIHEARTRLSGASTWWPQPLARSPVLVDAAADAAERFRALRVAVIGAGGIGGRVALLLARGGVRELLVVDGAEVKPESLLTHDVAPTDVGRPKAALVARQAKQVAPGTRVRYACSTFEVLPRDVLVGFDLVVLASDNLAAELAVGEACRRRGVRVVQASLYGPTLTAEVRSLANTDPHGPCLVCAWAEADWARLDAGTRFECLGATGATLPHTAARPSAARSLVPTRTTPELCATAASLAVSEVRRRCLGLDLPADIALEWSGFGLRTVEARLERLAVCAADHARWVWVEHTDFAGATPWELVVAASGASRRSRAELYSSASLEVDGYEYSSRATCGCGAQQRERVFLPGASDWTVCTRCGERLAARGASWRETPLDALASALDVPIASSMGRDASQQDRHTPAVIVRIDGAAPVIFHSQGPIQASS